MMTTGIYTMTTRDAMTRRTDTIKPVDSIHTALETMVNLGLSALPVVNDQKECVGVLTKTDVIKLTGKFDEADRTCGTQDLAALYFGVALDEITKSRVEDVMTSHVIFVKPDDLLTEAAAKMLLHEIHHVPVCNARREVVGMVSSMDVLKAI